MATVSLGGSLEEKIAAISAAGFDGIELLDADLTGSGMTPEECALRCADAGLSIDLYQPFRRAEGVAPEEFATVRQRLRSELSTMQRLGTEAILVVSNTDADAIDDRDLSIAQVSALADDAAAHGMAVMFEALCWGTHIASVADAWEVVRAVSRDNVSLVIDTFHLLAGGEDAAALAGIPSSKVGFLQLADAPLLSLELIQWSRNHRCFPGEGEFDLDSPVGAVLASGYDGPVSLEIFNPSYRALPVGEVAQRGADALRALLDGVTAPVG
ncbi:sugar phosphate isomerase/epimerase [Microbacterium sp. VKM Ac-2923]|uniref:sugar phosphate isomerase/epimerase family protein n=1 Tax=Microbacterium sp. VKM Ac-2923 TaxID=2929476 RepID=UPI001FB271B3|nr:sugar phosphate isomerase/epimerase [Microbacterium sp. VKM Ac-2923]MCJ1708522.1 sugar phosphate isomerase/epimerase [Microbacterium sp. VKM Ac-2923]